MALQQTTAPASRQTKYSRAVYEALGVLKHATNTQILNVVRQAYPEVSITTIYRVTTRLKARGIIAGAPQTIDATERYDIATVPHHHFMCTHCSALCDVPNTTEAQQAVELLKGLSKRCKLAGSVTLQGTCLECTEITKKQKTEP